ncbi:hypothetical protein Htur_2467 [Haloterrigena turkmenica DSM 5511]|uniref:Uncharacterized protein n=1 Tax=Haloterrigena turkmenica (strain ATCC 51198 / DSM 5511 / JCM 9101 / NCIMB 13204 / VKM B-1734 / 4k) TaxID=543526 RepID=D2RVE4_HALTV|nr:hypothetical protein [Haloterrigena turkmenica]ADB61345.1 hypothetical protein Htur_2467 [Haloterrigena turkmenica DSM 5511]
MTRTGRYGDLDYPTLTKGGFLLGLGLLVLGAAGELLGHAFVGQLPAWEHTLFTFAEGGGLIIGFFSVWIFGVILPLTE